jgi:hypothetical protein
LNEAVDVLVRAVERSRRIRYSLGEAEALIGLARAWRLLGATDKALSCADEAIAIADALSLSPIRARADTEYAAALDAAHRQHA